MAGMDEEYEQFFFREDMEWRKNGRRALRIYEIGYKGMEVMVNEPVRKWQKKDVWQGTERMYICRVLKQIWFLLAEAPMRWDTILRRRMMDRPPGLV